MNYHKCDKMPQGTVIENIDTTYVPITFDLISTLIREPKTSEWRLMYSNYGYVNQVKVLYCPYCGMKLEDKP